MSSWSNPNPSPGYAELMRGHSFSGGGGGAGHVQPNQWAEAGQQAISAVAKLLQERKRQQIAQTLLDHASYDSNNGEGDPLARSLNESHMPAAEAWSAYQQQREYDADQLNQNIKAQHYQRMAAALENKSTGQREPIPIRDNDGNIIGYSSPTTGTPHLLPTGSTTNAGTTKATGASLKEWENPSRLGVSSDGSQVFLKETKSRPQSASVSPEEFNRMMADQNLPNRMPTLTDKFDPSRSNPPLETSHGTVKMKSPDGTVKEVPADQVDYYKKLGAVIVQ